MRVEIEGDATLTVEEFDAIIGHLIKIVMPPNVSDDDPNPSEVLDVLLKYTEEVRGQIIQQTIRGD